MARETKKTERKPANAEELIDQYHAIGPAAILAALIYTPRRITVPAPARKAA
jgi:hypothetical protein